MFVLLRKKKPHMLSVVDAVAKGRSVFSELAVCCFLWLEKPLKLTVFTGFYNNPSEEILF